MAAKTSIRRILVPTDFSASSRAAYPMALAQAKAMKAGIVLLHVVDLMPLVTLEGGMVPVKLEGHESAARRRLEAEAKRLRGAKVKSVSANGAPADEIVRQAKKQGCGMIVMSTHGHRGLMAWVLGSVAERVLRGAECPVLVVKP